MTVHLPRRLWNSLRIAARDAFPNEEFAILLGKRLKNKDYQIKYLFFPPNRSDTEDPVYVNTQNIWYEAAEKLAKQFKLEVLGDIHTHCYDSSKVVGVPGAHPSEIDWIGAESLRLQTGGKYRLMGIVRVLKKGKRMLCTVRFWPAISLPITKI